MDKLITDTSKDACKHDWIKDLSGEGAIKGTYLVREKRTGVSRKGESYLMLTLADRTGEIEARIWERADNLSPLFKRGDVVRIQGQASSFRGQIQVNVTSLAPAGSDLDPAVFIESSPMGIPQMMNALREVMRDISNPHVRAVIDRFLGDTDFMSRFKKAPAAKNFHHCYLGGLLEHTLSVCRLASSAALQYQNLDRDILLAGAFLHDIGKVRELSYDLQIDYTDEGRLVGHVVLGASMLDEKIAMLRGFPQELAIRLRHLILSHHGEYAFGSPKKPKFPEAFALHLLDDLDAKLNGIERIMERDREDGSWTQYNRLLERYLLKGEIHLAEEIEDGGNPNALRQGDLFTV